MFFGYNFNSNRDPKADVYPGLQTFDQVVLPSLKETQKYLQEQPRISSCIPGTIPVSNAGALMKFELPCPGGLDTSWHHHGCHACRLEDKHTNQNPVTVMLELL